MIAFKASSPVCTCNNLTSNPNLPKIFFSIAIYSKAADIGRGSAIVIVLSPSITGILFLLIITMTLMIAIITNVKMIVVFLLIFFDKIRYILTCFINADKMLRLSSTNLVDPNTSLFRG